MRYELKYTVDHLSHEAVIAQLLTHPASFREIYPDRQVNNYYFDTTAFHCFHQNIEGSPRRRKMRLRWYGPNMLPTTPSILEFKNKKNELGWKDTYSIQSDIVDLLTLKEGVQKVGLFKAELCPVLKNTYNRSYFISADGKYRITVDRDQSFSIPFTKVKSLKIATLPIVVELKFEAKDFENVSSITDFIPYRQSKNSKYATGIQVLYL